MARVCVDACFLIGLYDKDDQYHDIAVRQFGSLFGEESGRHQLVAPWPVLYECLGTRYARNTATIPQKRTEFTRYWDYLSEGGQLVLLDDGPFREVPLSEHLAGPTRILSLVDRVLRAMILDQGRLFDFFLTYNTGDFTDACQASNIPLINEKSLTNSYGF